MLQRVLEPEVMDSEEEAQDYDAMDHITVNRVFVADFLSRWHRQNPILDVGTGTAQIPIELCKTDALPQVVAIDLAVQMIAVGQTNVQKQGLSGRIRLQVCDAKQMPFPDKCFAAVISNSIVHHIPEPQSVFGEICRVVQTGGVIFIRDLLRPPSLDMLHQLVKQYAGGANAHQQKMFADSLHAALSLDEVQDLVGKLGLSPGDVRQTSDRHWTWAAVAPPI